MHGTNEVQVIVISFSFHLCVPKRYTNRFVMHVSKGKLNVDINTWFIPVLWQVLLFLNT